MSANHDVDRSETMRVLHQLATLSAQAHVSCNMVIASLRGDCNDPLEAVNRFMRVMDGLNATQCELMALAQTHKLFNKL